MKKNKLIQPVQVAQAAKRKAKENMRFRSYLKNHADPDVLDRQFLDLHRQILPRYNCSRCRNRCKLLHATIPDGEIDRDAACLNMTREEFIAAHLEQDRFGEWTEKHLPCGFLMEDGSCRLGDCRPDSCKQFPYTDQPERLFSLYSVLSAVEVCPAAYEIFEALKQLYDFDSYRKSRRRSNYSAESDAAFSLIADDAFCDDPLDFPEEPEASPLEELPF